MRIDDNSRKKKEEFQEIPSLVSCIADKTLQQLENEGLFVFPEILSNAEDIAKNQMILQSVNDNYHSGNIMGFIGLGSERLVIKSRFSDGEDYFFHYLLENVLGVPTNIVNMETDANQENKLYNLMLFLFPRYLKAAIRKGVYRTYINKQYNDDNVRGTIDIDRHIKWNIPFTGSIAYNQREFDCDNYLIELVRHTIEYIRKSFYGNLILNSIKDEIQLIVSATPSYRASERNRVIEENQKNVIRHAYYHEYRALQQLCILILNNEKHQIGFGSKRVYGILFDGAWLWEEYVANLLNKNGEAFYHPMNRKKYGKQWLFANRHASIYPDFIGKNNQNRIVADAKYKIHENIGYSNKDYFQVLAYMYRFDACKGLFLYPEKDSYKVTKMMLNRGISFESNEQAREDVCVIKIGLVIPREIDNYDDFVLAIKKNEKMFIEDVFKS